MHLETIQPSVVQTYLCENVADEFSKLKIDVRSKKIEGHVLAYQWDELPAQSQFIDNLLDILSQAALDIWPHWYNNDQLLHSVKKRHTDKIISNFLHINDIVKTRQNISKSWLRQSIGYCHSGKRPRFKAFPKAVQISQLALAIDPDQLIIALGINDQKPAKTHMLGLAKAADWVAYTANAGVAIFLPEKTANNRELDSILYQAISLDSFQTTLKKEAKDDKTSLVTPIPGLPHPGSPGEQELHKRLQKDKELAGLFVFNQRLITKHHAPYIVDLVWQAGKVVVEVDGYKYHSNQYAFRDDRLRDYELVINGYLVLRLPHDLIMEDPARELEKIRNVVRFRKKQLMHTDKVKK